MSPSALSPAGYLEDNPFEAEFNDDHDDDDDLDDDLTSQPVLSMVKSVILPSSTLPSPNNTTLHSTPTRNTRGLPSRKRNSIRQNDTLVSGADRHRWR